MFAEVEVRFILDEYLVAILVVGVGEEKQKRRYGTHGKAMTNMNVGYPQD